MKVYISGGCKNGKSSYAERLSQNIKKADTPLYYLATMIPKDEEDKERIKRHQQDREGCGFETVEVGCDIIVAIGKCDKHGTFLLDSVTALLANEMFNTNNGDISGFSINTDAYKKITSDLTEIISKLSNIIIISDYIYSDAFLYDDLTEAYRRGLAHIDKQIARLCDVVLEFCYGNVIIHKGTENEAADQVTLLSS